MRILLALLLLTIAPILDAQAQPGAASLQGNWHQIVSNAGQCEDCRISIERKGLDFHVTASNGWSAVVRPHSGDVSLVLGQGRWQPNSGGTYGGRSFDLLLGVIDDKLIMIMTVRKPGGRISRIKAAFEKQEPAGEAI